MVRFMRLCSADVYVVAIDTVSSGVDVRKREKQVVEALMLYRFGHEVTVRHRPSGAPYADYTADHRESAEMLPSISLSHGGGWAVLAVGGIRDAIGVDIEAPRNQLFRVIDRFVSPTEKERWDCTSLSVLQWLWTVKEAVYKAALTPGLPLKEIEVLTPCLTRVRTLRAEFATESVKLNECTLTVARPKGVIINIGSVNQSEDDER